MFTSAKTKTITTITTGVLLLLLLIQCFPGVALGFDVHARIRDFVSSQVEKSDEIIKPNRLKIKTTINQGTEWLGNKYRAGFSFIERKTGINEQNNAYKTVKNCILKNVGYGLGLYNGAGELAAEFYTFAAMLPTAPERLVNFGYKYAEAPQMYQDKVTNGARAAVGVALNPLPLLSGLYQYGKSTYTEAAKDPLELGILYGETTVYAGSFLIGGAQIKGLTLANKANKVEKSYSLISSPLSSWKMGLKNLLSNNHAAVFSASVESLNNRIINLPIKHRGKEINIVSAENGQLQLNREIFLTPKQFRELTYNDLINEELEFLALRLKIEDLDDKILKMFKSGEISIDEARICNGIVDQSILITNNVINQLIEEKHHIDEMRKVFPDTLMKGHSLEELGLLEQNMVAQIKQLKESEMTSKALIIENQKLLGKTRLAKKELKQLSQGIPSDDISRATIDQLMHPTVKYYLSSRYSFDELGKLVREVKEEKEYFIKNAAEVQKLYAADKGNKKLVTRMQALVRANWDHGELLNRIKTVKSKVEKRLTGTPVTETLLEKDLLKTFTSGDLKRLQVQVGEDINYLVRFGASRENLALHKSFYDRLKVCIQNAKLKEREAGLSGPIGTEKIIENLDSQSFKLWDLTE